MGRLALKIKLSSLNRASGFLFERWKEGAFAAADSCKRGAALRRQSSTRRRAGGSGRPVDGPRKSQLAAVNSLFYLEPAPRNWTNLCSVSNQNGAPNSVA